MTYIADKDFLIEVQKGNVAGHRLVHKFGRNPALQSGTFEFVNLLGFATGAWPLSAATTVRVKSGGSSADVAGGAGATKVTVLGIVATTFAEETETLVTAGTSASSASSKSFWRVHRAWVGDEDGANGVGTYGAANTAAITIENSGGGTDLIQIAAGQGQTQFAGWSVPADKTAYLLSALINVDSIQDADVTFYARENFDDTSADMSAKRLKIYLTGVSGTVPFVPRSPLPGFGGKTDLWWEAQGSGGTSAISIDFELLVVDD